MLLNTSSDDSLFRNNVKKNEWKKNEWKKYAMKKKNKIKKNPMKKVSNGRKTVNMKFIKVDE